jgi:DNA invertase Pin-like site-specific DNA recombinase
MRGRWVSYYRVSTKRQGESGLGLDAQKEAVRSFVAGGQLLAEFEEVESGKRDTRPALEAALRECRLRKATLVIAKLDRLSRSVSFIARLMEAGTEFVALDMPNANAFTVHVLAAVAEHERKLISERTRSALAAAKARGVRLGGRRGSHLIEDHGAVGRERSLQTRQEIARHRDAGVLEVVKEIAVPGTSLAKIAGALNERSIPAPRGGTWCAGQVGRVLRREGQISYFLYSSFESIRVYPSGKST